MNVVRLSDLAWEEQHSPTRKFHSFCRNVSLALGGIRNVGLWGGGHPFDVQIRRIPPGASVCPMHAHLAQWELFVVRSGSGSVRLNDTTHAIKTGDVFIHPPGETHQLINSGAVDLEVLIIADNPPLDAFYYPDSNKWGLRPPGKYFRATEVNYFEGEDAPIATSRAALPPPVAMASFQKIHLDDLAWEEWRSPKGKFRGTSKELSIALGAKRRTPTGLGGHPFDLELSKLAPRESGCPFHSHAAQWEMFFILSGTAIIRADQETRPLIAGDVCLQPPGVAHQITNGSGTEDLIFFLVADNPPIDIWHYPDSNKWGFNTPRKFFRPSEVDYWDGEE